MTSPVRLLIYLHRKSSHSKARISDVVTSARIRSHKAARLAMQELQRY